MNYKPYSILIVDDIESLRVSIQDFLKKDYVVYVAESGYQALDILSKYPIDMIISDIRMLDMDGITLLKIVQKEYPNTKYALITAYNVNDYISFAKEYKIWNIIPKTSFLDLTFIKTMIYKLLTNDIFGFDKYFSDIQIVLIKLSEIYKLYKENFPFFPEKLFIRSKFNQKKKD